MNLSVYLYNSKTCRTFRKYGFQRFDKWPCSLCTQWPFYPKVQILSCRLSFSYCITYQCHDQLRIFDTFNKLMLTLYNSKCSVDFRSRQTSPLTVVLLAFILLLPRIRPCNGHKTHFLQSLEIEDIKRLQLIKNFRMFNWITFNHSRALPCRCSFPKFIHKITCLNIIVMAQSTTFYRHFNLS